MLNLCYILSDIHSSYNMEWALRELNKRYALSVILLNKDTRDSPLKSFLTKHNIPFKEISYSKKISLLPALFKTIFYLLSNKIKIVHCHLFEASLVGLTAAKILMIKKRIYTRHNSTINLKYYPNAVKYDKMMNLLATHIISISDVVTDVLINKENVKKDKIVKIHHGFDFEKINELAGSKFDIRRKYNIPSNKKYLGVVARYIEYKGLQYSLPAIFNYAEKNNAFVIIANANGPFKKEVNTIIEKHPNVELIEIPFEENAYGLMANFDVLIHTPIAKEDEAFGQIYIEAMHLEVPIISTLSGILNEFPKDKKYFYPVDYKNQIEIETTIESVLSDKNKDEICQSAKRYVEEHFFISSMINDLDELYLK